MAATEYTTILMDPPWMERGGGRIKRGADRHYKLVKPADMHGVIVDSGVWRPAAACSLWMWATANHLGEAMRLIEELGFTYVTNLVWVKSGGPGLGQRFRMRHEHLLYARRGKVPVPPPERRCSSAVQAPRGRHSEKPQTFMDVIELHDPPGPRLEMFARASRPGWDAWGNQL